MFSISFVLWLCLFVNVHALKILPLDTIDEVTFYPGDTIDLGIVLFNNESRDVELLVEQYLLYPEAKPMPLYEKVVLPANNHTMITDMSFDVSEISPSGEYNHIIKIYEEGKLIAENQRTFYIQAAEKRFDDVEILICADETCNDIRPVFVLGETVYIKVKSSHNPEIKGFIKSPKGGHINLSFYKNTANFKANSAGEYMLTILLSKDGFASEEINNTIEFVKEYKKPPSYFCGEIEDGVCEENCPTEDVDCKKITEMSNNTWGFYMIIILFISMIALVIILTLWKFKTRL